MKRRRRRVDHRAGKVRGWLSVGFSSLALACASARSGEEDPVEVPDSKVDLALSFDGDDYVTTGTAGFPFPQARQTISFWFKPKHYGGTQTIVALRMEFASGVQIGIRRGGLEAWSVYSGRTYVGAPDAPTPGVWHHVAYSWSGQEHRLYLNGRVVGHGRLPPNNRRPNACWLGSVDGYHEFYQGDLDEVRVWSELRTPQQIQQELRGETDLDLANLVAWLVFNEREGAAARDRSGLGNHALLGDGVEPHVPRRIESGVPSAR